MSLVFDAANDAANCSIPYSAAVTFQQVYTNTKGYPPSFRIPKRQNIRPFINAP